MLHDETVNGRRADDKPWGRRDETDKAYRAFCIYRELGPGPGRSLHSAYRRYVEERDGEDPGAGICAPSYFQAWSSRHDWVARVRAWDAYLDRQAREAAEEEYLENLQKFREKRLSLAQKVFEGGDELLTKLLGRVGTLEPDEIEASDLWRHIKALVELFELASTAEQEALGIERLIDILKEQGKL